jgi:alpha-beta hydrolase superfamily lysophospholipase
MQDLYYPSKDGQTTIHACIWRPRGEIKAIVQIIHGMAEYAERYAAFAEYLNKFGYLVCADDHLGHGKSVVEKSKLGHFVDGTHSADIVLQDIKQFSDIIKEKYPDVPLFLMGHSMGSFFTRTFLSKYSDMAKGAVIMGTGYISNITTGFAKFVTRTVAFFHGWSFRSKFIDNLAFGGYLKKVDKRRTKYDWLSRNTENVDNYIADELCGVPFTCSGFYGLFDIISRACSKKVISSTPKDLPLFLVSGSEDPVGNYTAGVKKLYDKYTAAGVKDLSMMFYSFARHEILNEDVAPQVMQDILQFYDGILSGDVGAVNGSTL